jgi:hypothetical protein
LIRIPFLDKTLETLTMKSGKQVRTTTKADRRNDAEKDDGDVDVDKEE